MSSQRSFRFSQYLSRYAAEEARTLPINVFDGNSFDQTCIIPLRRECWGDVLRLITQFESLVFENSISLFVVFVVNDLAPTENNHDYSFFINHFKNNTLTIHPYMFLEKRKPHLQILWVDRFQTLPFSKKQGVGLARKIGCDIVTQLTSHAIISSRWLRTTDADAEIPPNYFTVLGKEKASAIHFSFRHDTSSFQGGEALTLYEIFLRYYFLGLSWARSPFAFPTIGSCLAIDQDSYVSVRGFPDRLAGEDFHLLNKLRKCGPVFYSQKAIITLRGRFSSRVPFGTGKATVDIFNMLERGEPFRLYHPDTFRVLKELLKCVELCLGQSEEFFFDELTKTLTHLCDQHSGLSRIFEEFEIEKIIQSSFQCRNNFDLRLQHFLTLFDGLKTLRFIHSLRRHCFPDEPWQSALQKAPFLSFDLVGNSASQVLKLLIEEERRFVTLAQATFEAPSLLSQQGQY